MSRGRVLVLVVVLAVAGLAAWLAFRPAAPTYADDVAPLVAARCAQCHHPGGPAPFPLLTYDDVRKRAAQIADLTGRRAMPPWMPEPGANEFVGDRSLSAAEIAVFARWSALGAPPGPPRPAPAPAWNDGWQIGTPDLVVALPEPFMLAAEGPDVYRNFVVPIPIDAARHVRAVEFRPGNPRAVHHAFLFVDPTRESLRLDERDGEPGFAGFHVPPSAQAPGGHFLSWQPGKQAIPPPEDLAWTLKPDSFLLLQVHLRPSGKPEQVRPSAGFYFTAKAPTRTPVKIGLWSTDIDLPEGDAARSVRDSFTVPIDLDVLRVLPHAHYLARRVEGTATLPDGSRRTLLRIPAWDFNWQGDYVYKDPIFLPRGTVVSMEIVYDNSAANPRNPHQPPRRVRYGLTSDDEMAELWLQAVPRRPQDRGILDRENGMKVLTDGVATNRRLVERDPTDGRARYDLGRALLFLGRNDEARPHLVEAARLQPDWDEARYILGVLHRTQSRPDEARAEFVAAIRLNPRHAKAHGNLGLVLMEQGRLDDAAAAFEAALRLDPGDELARESLEQIHAARRKR